MDSNSFTGLINNVALLVAVGVAYSYVVHRLRGREWSGKLIGGLLLGLAGIGVMMNPWQMMPGVIFDSRSILLSTAALFMGAVPLVVAVIVTSLYRVLVVGGAGAFTGIAVIVSSALIGWVWARTRSRPACQLSGLEYYLFGVVVHINMLLWMLSLPHPIGISALLNITAPVLLVFPFGTVLFAKLLAGQEQHLQDRAALVESEARFKALSDSSPLTIYLSTGPERKAAYVNPTFVRMFGYTVSDIPTADRWWPLAYPDEDYRREISEEWWRRVDHAKATGSEAEPMESVVTCKDGSRKNILWGFKTIGDENWAFGLDLTERKRAESALQESESMFRALAEQAVTGIYLFQESRFLYVNQQFSEIFGYSPNEILGSLTFFDLVAPEEPGDIEEGIQAQLFGEVPHAHHTIQILRKNGERRWVEVYGTRIDVKGIPTIAGTVLDITERKQVEVALHESEQRLRLTMEMANIAVWEYDFPSNTMLRTPNHDRLYGLEWQKAWQLDTFTNATHPDDRARSNRIIMESAVPGGPDRYSFDFRVIWPDGSLHWLWVMGEVIKRDSTGMALLVSGVLLDVTKRKQADEEISRLHQALQLHAAGLEKRVAKRTAELEVAKVRAESADRVKSAFLATMSHELRTPLTSIIGFTGLLLQKLPGPLNPEQEKQLGFVRGSSEHLLALINDVLDISKVEAGEMSLIVKPFDLGGLLERVGEAFSQEAAHRGLEFDLNVGESNVVYIGDARRVEQVFNNLLSNAMKFTLQGSIGFSCVREDDFFIITVSDTGVGIKAEDMNRLFRPFSQIENQMPRLNSGTGLGLAISLHLARAMGGDLTAQSEWGKGSRFVFRLPTEGTV